MKITLALTTLLPFAAWAATANPDAAFYKHAAEGGLAEVQMGQLAQEKSTDAGVKDFGSMMVSDHSAANDKLKALAATKNVDLPTSPSIGQMAAKTKLEVLSGHTFDKSYIKGMIKDHEDDIAMFNKEASSGMDPDAKAYAAATLPTLKKHLKAIRAIAANTGLKTD
jgi:putative membrane protein